MKIVFLARYLPAEGSTTHMYELARQMILKGNEVTIISAGHLDVPSAKEIYNQSIDDGIVHINVKFPHKSNKTFFGKVGQLITYTVVKPTVIKILKQIKPDIIHAHYPVTTFSVTR